MRLTRLVIVGGLMCVLLSAQAARTSTAEDCEHSPEALAYEKQGEARKAELIRINGPGTNAALKSKLLQMGNADQAIRMKLFGSPADEQAKLAPELDKTDRALTEELKKIVAQDGWPTIASVGFDASQATILILIHSPDHDFQRKLLPQLEQLVRQKKIMGDDIATLIDKMLVASGKPQRFGTQFSWHGNGPMKMEPVEDPFHLSERRDLYSLPPLDLYRCELEALYHRSVQ